MPKIQQIKRLQRSFDNKQYEKNKAPYGSYSFRDQNSNYHTAKPIPIHQTTYNPQFSKSPLASVQMSRNYNQSNSLPRHIQVNDQFNTQPQIYKKEKSIYHEQTQQKINCKKMWPWILGALLLIGLAIGLYFLIDLLLGKKNSNNTQVIQTQYPDYVYNNNKDSISPITVNPIPYSTERSISNDYISSVSSALPNTYIQSSSLSNTQQLTTLSTVSTDTNSYFIPNTYVSTPTITSMSNYPTSTTSTNSFANNFIEPPNTKIGLSENYVTPIDVYSGSY